MRVFRWEALALLICLFYGAESKQRRLIGNRCSLISVIMDESGSMSGEQAFIEDVALPNLIEGLELSLGNTTGSTVFVCIYGYAGHSGFTPSNNMDPHVHGCSIGFNADDYQFVANGSDEDGYAAIRFANDDFNSRTEINGTSISSCETLTKFMILVTDDRNFNFVAPFVDRDNVTAILDDGEWILHAIIDTALLPASPTRAVGTFNNFDGTFTSLIPDPTATGSRYRSELVNGSPLEVPMSAPNVDYAELVFEGSGVLWDLNQLRAGGVIAEIFSEAYVDVTEEAILNPPTNAPSALPSVSPSEHPTAFPSSAPSLTRKPCVFFAVVMDETYSMSIEQQTISTILEELDSGLRDDFFVFICTFGFGRSGGSASSVKNGCSLGFDSGDFRFEQTGSMEDGWEAILFADDYFSNEESIDGILFDPQCTSTQKYMYLITDEDRDAKASLSLQNVTDVLSYGGWTLTSVMNLQLGAAVGAKLNGADSFTVYPATAGDAIYSSTSPILSGFGSTVENYVPLVESTAGSLWSISALRRGGKAAEALVQSFVSDAFYRILGD